jgi:hypothetical protein
MAGMTQTFKAALIDVDTTPIELLGTIRNDVNAVYKYVKFSGTTVNAAGDFVGYVVADLLGQTVDGASAVVGAGMSVAAHPAGSITYGWIQVAGIAVVNGVTSTAGNELKMTGTKTVGAKAAASDASVAIALVTAAGVAAQIFLICPY